MANHQPKPPFPPRIMLRATDAALSLVPAGPLQTRANHGYPATWTRT